MDPVKLLEEAARRRSQRKLFEFYGYEHSADHPGAYPWQVEFHNAGAQFKERLLMAGNRVGKSSAGAAEMACHLTGEYPVWWRGKKFEHPIDAWCGSESSEASRDVVQNALLGPEGSHGTGWIPASRLAGKVKYRQAGVADVAEMIYVRHKAGGYSSCSLKTYEQGRSKWQGEEVEPGLLP